MSSWILCTGLIHKLAGLDLHCTTFSLLRTVLEVGYIPRYLLFTV